MLDLVDRSSTMNGLTQGFKSYYFFTFHMGTSLYVVPKRGGLQIVV